MKNTEPRDFCGKLIEEGDVIAIAMTSGSTARLRQRIVREIVHDDKGTHIVVQQDRSVVTDKRSLGRITNFHNCIIIIS